MQTELLPESGALVSRNGRRGYHRKAASDTFAWAASALLGELPPQAQQIPSELDAVAANPGSIPAVDRYAPTIATYQGSNLNGILPEDIFDLLQDVDEDEVLEVDEVDVDEDTDIDETSFGVQATLSPVAAEAGRTAVVPGAVSQSGPCLTASSGLGPDCSRGPPVQDQTKPVSRLRVSAGGAASGSKRGAGDSGGGAPASRHVRHPSDHLGHAQLLPLQLDKPLSDFTGQTRANAFDPSQLDPKRAKRIIANRQSAHRSRMKKLQAIHGLEELATASKACTDTLRQQVAAATTRRRQALGAAAEVQRQLAALQQELAAESHWQDAILSELMKLGITAPAPVGFSAGKQLSGLVLSEPQLPPPLLSATPRGGPPSRTSVASPLTPLPLPAAPAFGPFQYLPSTGLPGQPCAATAVPGPVPGCSPLLLSSLACSPGTGGLALPLGVPGFQPRLASCGGARENPSCSPSSASAAGLAPAGPGALHGSNRGLPHPTLQNPPLHTLAHPQQTTMMPRGPSAPHAQPAHHTASTSADGMPLTAAASGLLGGAPLTASSTLLPKHTHALLHPQLHPPYHLQQPLLTSSGTPSTICAACHMAFPACPIPSPVVLSAATTSAFYTPTAGQAGAVSSHPTGMASCGVVARTGAIGGGAKPNGYLQGAGGGDSPPAGGGVLVGDSSMALSGVDVIDSVVMTDLATFLGEGLEDGVSAGAEGYADG